MRKSSTHMELFTHADRQNDADRNAYTHTHIHIDAHTHIPLRSVKLL